MRRIDRNSPKFDEVPDPERFNIEETDLHNSCNMMDQEKLDILAWKLVMQHNVELGYDSLALGDDEHLKVTVDGNIPHIQYERLKRNIRFVRYRFADAAVINAVCRIIEEGDWDELSLKAVRSMYDSLKKFFDEGGWKDEDQY